MNKLHIATAGVAQDVSFPDSQNPGKNVTAFQIPCTGTIDGTQSQFTIKIYGVGSNEKIKSGITVNGEFNARYNIYDVKKKDNPQLFAGAGGTQFGGGNKGGFEQRKFINYELEAVKLAVDIVKSAATNDVDTGAAGSVSAEQMAEKAVAIARSTFVPYLRSVSQRHDEVAKVDDAKKLQGQAIRQIIEQNGLTDAVRASGATNGILMAEYEAAGRDGSRFINAIRAKFAGKPVPATEPGTEFDDDIPF